MTSYPKGEAPKGSRLVPTPFLPSLYTEISYEEHLKNLELMCKTDREFMKRVRLFCDENKEENFPNVEQPLQHPEPASQHEEGSK